MMESGERENACVSENSGENGADRWMWQRENGEWWREDGGCGREEAESGGEKTMSGEREEERVSKRRWISKIKNAV
ncbi:hypothetical protein ACSQ67_025570 [Phaseolus vulgaris]